MPERAGEHSREDFIDRVVKILYVGSRLGLISLS
jgi:hypothetical protein